MMRIRKIGYHYKWERKEKIYMLNKKQNTVNKSVFKAMHIIINNIVFY